eukprot:TRINITY_DN4393_c0_g1_i14.p3 TRINITY_DN4393_c0_g1~~TRINITY_DN4393_c0_g1_i14.p3  ORF type:complete len:118 (-),score=32.32 TRINITY_DN4393_c0_g1_i14:194-547(-)
MSLPNQLPLFTPQTPLSTPPRPFPQLAAASSVTPQTPETGLDEYRERQAGMWKAKVEEAKGHSVEKCLKNHEVGPRERMLMVNWMAEVLKVFRCDDRSLFVAVMIMDTYYKNTKVYV